MAGLEQSAEPLSVFQRDAVSGDRAGFPSEIAHARHDEPARLVVHEEDSLRTGAGGILNHLQAQRRVTLTRRLGRNESDRAGRLCQIVLETIPSPDEGRFEWRMAINITQRDCPECLLKRDDHLHGIITPDPSRHRERFLARCKALPAELLFQDLERSEIGW